MKKQALIVFVTILLISPIVTPALGQSGEINFPIYVRDEDVVFSTNSDNDIYVKSEQYHQLVNYGLTFNASSMNQRSYNDYTRSTTTPRDADDPFTIGDTGIYEFMNTTSAGQELKYIRNYFGLISSNTSDIKNTFIESGNTYLVSFNTDNLDPVSFEFLFSQISGATTLTLTLSIVDPEGNFDSINIGITKGVVQIAPFVPKLPGEHFLSIVPNRDAVMADMKFNISPDIKSISRGLSEHLDQDESFARYYKVENSGQAQVVDFNSIVFQNSYFVNDITTRVFGDVRVLIFEPDSLMFGNQANSLLITASSDFYIALVANPADENEPGIKAARTNEVYDKGMDIDLTMVLRTYDVTNLPINEDFTADEIEPYSFSSGTRFYSFTTNTDVLLGVNASSNDVLDFTSNDPEIGSFSARDGNNDILNNNADDAVILPAGTYSVEVTTQETYHVTVFEPTTINPDASSIFTGTFGDISIYYLPSSEVIDDRLDLTYLDTNNETVTYEINFYDADGTDRNDPAPTTLQYYINNLDNLVFNNVTSESHNRFTNLEGMYFKLEVVNNEKFINGTSAYFDVTNITSQIRINRFNDYDELQANDPNGAYYYDVLNQAVAYDLSENNLTTEVILDFTTEENKVYKLIIHSTNRSIDFFDLYVQNNAFWFNGLSSNTIVNITNIDHYFLEVVFATTAEIHMGVFLTMGTEVANGTLNIDLVELELTEFPALNVGSLNAADILTGDDDDDDGGLFSNPIVIAVSVAALVGVGVLVYFMQKRRNSL